MSYSNNSSDVPMVRKHSEKNDQIQNSFNQEQEENKVFSKMLISRHRGIISRIFPSKAEQEADRFQSELMNSIGRSRIENFRMYKEFQRQAIKETFDAMLIEGKVKLRKDNTLFFAGHLKDLQSKVTMMSNEFMQECEQQVLKIESSRTKMIRERQERMLEKRMDEFEESIELLMSSFQNILKEGV